MIPKPVLISFGALVTLGQAANQAPSTISQRCPCGFVDPSSSQVFTESLIVYFNETSSVPLDLFGVLEYEHKKERGSSTIYRQGSTSKNAVVDNVGALSWQDRIDGNGSSLELYVDPTTPKHLVNGAQLRSIRQDIMYGTFRASMRSAQPNVGGSALTLALLYNDTASVQMDMLNMDEASDARVTQLINGEWPENTKSVNYTVLAAGSRSVPALQPWDFVELGFDWLNTSISFFIADNRTRHSTKHDRSMPVAPMPLEVRHWSTGDPDYMQGPPPNRSIANVQWVRAFFNSSLWSDEEHHDFDRNCVGDSLCSTRDTALRGSTIANASSSVRWKQPVHDRRIRWQSGVVAGVFSSFGVIFLINAVVRRGPWRSMLSSFAHRKEEDPTPRLRKAVRNSVNASINAVDTSGSGQSSNGIKSSSAPSMSTNEAIGQFHQREPSLSSIPATPLPTYASPVTTPQFLSAVPSYHSLRADQSDQERSRSESTCEKFGRHDGEQADSFAVTKITPRQRSIRNFAAASRPAMDTLAEHDTKRSGEEDKQDGKTACYGETQDGVATEDFEAQHGREEGARVDSPPSNATTVRGVTAFREPPLPTSVEEAATTMLVPATQTGASVNKPQQQRIDYLAGFLVFSCLTVTFRHFSLTFWPYVTEASGPTKHFAADTWLAFILGPYILTPMCIGPFFVTSCRFLVTRYLKNGQLSDVANKVLLRGPRMLIPCFIFMIMEYFLLSLGTVNYLEWLPSISWSVWPSASPQPNFAVFLNEMVELSYLVPNAAPEVINHYCVGVLWTIPVQHFFSYVTLLAAVMIRDVQNPWKRTLFYGLSISAGWYATSWSACHWAGLMLADLDVTYNSVKLIQARWWLLYPVLTVSTFVALASPLTLLFNSEIFDWSFMSYEAAIHPDATTGLPIIDTITNIYLAYPDYYSPSLAVLLFSVSLQVIVEVSQWAQWFFSLEFFTILHPHIMTIYLLHGFIFWSLGSWLAVTLAVAGCPYWAVLLIVAVVCYGVIFMLVFLLTPLVEFVTQATMRNIWRWATEEPVPSRQTIAPFSKSLILDRSSASTSTKQGKEHNV